ncbi:MAG TPA: acyltransferase [Parasegetibacter sp.]
MNKNVTRNSFFGSYTLSLKEHLLPLDGFRGLAVLLVLIYHFFPVFRVGWVGVDLFFALSGFLITGKLFEVKFGEADLNTYFRNRILRILPAYISILVITYLGIFLIPEERITASMEQLKDLLPYYSTFTLNIWTSFEGWPLNIMLVHLWSVSTEIQFYLIWPLFIILIPSARKGMMFCLLIMLLALVVRVLPGEEIGLHNIYRYSSLPARFDSFAAGSLLFILFNAVDKQILKQVFRILLPLSGVAWLLALGYMFPWHYSQDIVLKWGTLLNVICWMSLIGFTLLYSNGFLHRIFTGKAIVWMGRYSYGMYIFHLPVWIIFEKLAAAGWISGWLAGLAAIPVTMFAGFCSYHLVEKYFLSKKKKIAEN